MNTKFGQIILYKLKNEECPLAEEQAVCQTTKCAGLLKQPTHYIAFKEINTTPTPLHTYSSQI